MHTAWKIEKKNTNLTLYSWDGAWFELIVTVLQDGIYLQLCFGLSSHGHDEKSWNLKMYFPGLEK